MFTQSLLWLAICALSAPSGAAAQGETSATVNTARYAQALEDLGSDTSLDQVLEQGVLSTIGRRVTRAYALTEGLHLRVRVMSGSKFLTAEDIPTSGGLALSDLERLSPELKQDALVDWIMTNRQQFRVQMSFGTQANLASLHAPDWQMVSEYASGPMAVEATSTKTTPLYLLKGYWEGRTPQLLPTQRYNCGEFALFPFSLLGDWATDQSPRASWNLVFSRGTYEGYCKGNDGELYHRVAWVQSNADGSVNRVYRLYLNPRTWRVAQIDELGPGLGFNGKVAAVISLSWYFDEVPWKTPAPETFEPHSLLRKQSVGATAQQAAARP